MEQILIVSDTHGFLRNYEAVLKSFGPVDRIIHLGDLEGDEEAIQRISPCPVEMVSGNNDFRGSLAREKELQIGAYRVFLTHGHCYHVHYGLDLLVEEALRRGCQIAMFGHTHKPVITYSRGITLLNPGSLTLPRPFDSLPSYIRMEIDREGEAHYTLCHLGESRRGWEQG